MNSAACACAALKYCQQYKDNYVLSDIQKQALVGIILGDGSLERAKPSHKTRLRIEQSFLSSKSE